MNRDLASKLIMEDFVEEEGSENMMVFSERIHEIRNLISVSPGWFKGMMKSKIRMIPNSRIS